MLRIDTVPLGAELVSVKVDEVERLHQGESCTDENGKPYWKRHAPILFPIVGKLKKNQTVINGKTYEMSQHGFARDMEFEPITKLDNFHSYVLRSNGKTLEKYPFQFSLYVTYMIDDNKLITKYKVINEGEELMPFGIGGHPAFKADIQNGGYYLEFEQEETKLHFLYLVDGLVGTEFGKDRLKDKKRVELTKDCFKNDAIIMKTITSDAITLKDARGKAILKVNFKGFPYLGVWSKPGAPFICIEPWYTTADNVNTSGIFKEKQGNITLKPHETFECEYSVEFF